MECLGVGLGVEFGFPIVTACVVCVCEWYGLRIELGVEIRCSVAGELVGGWCACLLSGLGAPWCSV